MTPSAPHQRRAPDVHDDLREIIAKWPTLSAERQAAILRLLETEEVWHD